jgi:exosortase/archaeosortase family protein
MVLAHLLLRSAWAKGLVIVAAIPLSIAKNGFRIFTLGVLAVYVDPSFLHGRLHHQGGIVFFLVFLAAYLILLRLVGWLEHKRIQPAVPNTQRTPQRAGITSSRDCYAGMVYGLWLRGDDFTRHVSVKESTTTFL